MSTPTIDEARLEAFMGRFVGDLGAAMTMPLARIGDELGLWRAMADGAPVTASELAARTGCGERYLQEWLSHMAAAEYVDYDAGDRTFTLPPEHALALADEESPVFVGGAFEVVGAVNAIRERLRDAYRSGEGIGWHEHHHDLFRGTERFFRPGYLAHLVPEWLPALDGVVERLKQGGSVADVGCGHGASTIIMAQAFPAARFVGFDYHEESIAAATAAAERAGVGDRVRFEVAPAADFPAGEYDLVCVFDCLHDMGDPVGAAAHVRSTLAPGGSWMVVEPNAGDRLEDNLHAVGRVFYGASSSICCPASLSQEGQAALGAQAGEARLSEVIKAGGFGSVRRVAETPFNIVLEARA